MFTTLYAQNKDETVDRSILEMVSADAVHCCEMGMICAQNN